MPIILDSELAKKLQGSMQSGEGVELPFPVAYVWTVNGKPGMKSQADARYFGGWACKVEDMDAVADQQALSAPAGWSKVDMVTNDGDEFEAYITRRVYVAPIAKRTSWLKDKMRYADYREGARRHLQMLCYLAEETKAGLAPWGPVVLTAKGRQVDHLFNAVNSWDKATAALRREVAPGVPAWCFYLAIGTFEKERMALNVGKPGAQSPITPLMAYIPKDMDADRLEKRYVGSDVAALMADLGDQAQPWLEAWGATNLRRSAAEAEDDAVDAPPNWDEPEF
jgi:hypothetical protein